MWIIFHHDLWVILNQSPVKKQLIRLDPIFHHRPGWKLLRLVAPQVSEASEVSEASRRRPKCAARGWVTPFDQNICQSPWDVIEKSVLWVVIMVGYGWIWLDMVGYGWIWLVLQNVWNQQPEYSTQHETIPWAPCWGANHLFHPKEELCTVPCHSTFPHEESAWGLMQNVTGAVFLAPK